MDIDPAQEWSDAQARVTALVVEVVGAAGEDALDVMVPACPDWRARDLLAHMIGLDRDVLDGDEPDDHDPAWTQSHVDRRRERPVADLLEEWRGLAPDLVDHLREDPRALGDAVIHEQDLRGALRRPGARATGGLAWVCSSMAARLDDRLDDRLDEPAGGSAASGTLVVALRTPDWSWTSGGGHADATARPDVVLESDLFTMARSLTCRRTTDQVRGLVVVGDVTPVLDAFAILGPLPDTPLPRVSDGVIYTTRPDGRTPVVTRPVGAND